MEIDFKKISSVSIANVCGWDAPDFCDAYIEEAEYDGKPMSEEMLEYIHEHHSDYVSECVYDSLY